MNYDFASTRGFYVSRRGRRLSQRTLAALAFTALPSVPNRRYIQAIAMYALRVLRFLREIIVHAREEMTLRDN